MSIYVIGNNGNNAHGLEFPQIELRTLNSVLQYRIVGKGISPKLAKLNPRLVLFRRVAQNKHLRLNSEGTAFEQIRARKIQYVITRPPTNDNRAVTFVDGETRDGWTQLMIQLTNGTTQVATNRNILNLFTTTIVPEWTERWLTRRSRNRVPFTGSSGQPASLFKAFAQYYGIGFACDNPDNIPHKNTVGNNLLFEHIAYFKLSVFQQSGILRTGCRIGAT